MSLFISFFLHDGYYDYIVLRTKKIPGNSWYTFLAFDQRIQRMQTLYMCHKKWVNDFCSTTQTSQLIYHTYILDI